MSFGRKAKRQTGKGEQLADLMAPVEKRLRELLAEQKAIHDRRRSGQSTSGDVAAMKRFTREWQAGAARVVTIHRLMEELAEMGRTK